MGLFVVSRSPRWMSFSPTIDGFDAGQYEDPLVTFDISSAFDKAATLKSCASLDLSDGAMEFEISSVP